jgi:hypothetical protein
MTPRMRKLTQLIALVALSASVAAAAVACGGSKKEAAEPAPVAAETPAPAATDPAAPAGGAATCEQVADHVIEVAMASDEYKNAKPEDQKAAQDQMPTLRGQIVSDCTTKPFPEEIKGCIMKAQSIQDMDGCAK